MFTFLLSFTAVVLRQLSLFHNCPVCHLQLVLQLNMQREKTYNIREVRLGMVVINVNLPNAEEAGSLQSFLLIELL